MKGHLEGKVALVTGGSSGIGRASALAFAREGAEVVVNANLNIEGGEETVRMIKEAGGSAIFVKADASKTAEVEAMVKKTVKAYGRLDCACDILPSLSGGASCFHDRTCHGISMVEAPSPQA